LDPAGQQFSSSSPVEVLQGKASLHVRGIFEKRLGGQGFDLHELAVFGSVLETLVSQEAVERLRKLFEKLAFPIESPVMDEEQVDRLVDVYMTAFILGTDLEKASEHELWDAREQIPNLYGFWHEAQQLAREVRTEVVGSRKYFNFNDISTILVQIGERFGKWQNTECQLQKKKLVKLESAEAGCVPLPSFYKDVVKSGGADWQFAENIDYLKQNGVIDESDPQNLKVMVANYMNMPGNCIASTRFYSVCCIDECEALIGHIERNVRSPSATPGELIALVSALPSSTVPANRTLSHAQSRRLYRIAEKHFGQVPIHGRLFTQWMHMVYPRECVYPHMSGTTKPLTAADWENATSRNSTATEEDMKRIVDNAPTLNAATLRIDQGQCGRWVDEEELYVGAQSHRRALHELETDMETWLAASSVALLCVLAATTLAVIHTFKSVKQSLCGSWKPNPFVLV